MTDSQKYSFSADINQLLNLIINTFYSNKDIFLRELISNASDATDKIRYQSLTDSSVLGEHQNLEILLETDSDANTFTIRDHGIGMTREDLVNNLGTIAKSGTKNFMEAMKSGADLNMIGQFGVGFYSAFLVADKIEVVSKNNNDPQQWKWSSDAGGSFTVEKDTSEPLGRGTSIKLFMKNDMGHYLEEMNIKKIVRRHSDFIDFLIKLKVHKTVERTVTDDDTDEESETKLEKSEAKPEESEAKPEESEAKLEESDAKSEGEESEAKSEDVGSKQDESEAKSEESEAKSEGVDSKPEESEAKSGDEKKPEKKTKTIKEEVVEWEPVNHQKPLWSRNPDDVSEEEYASFYKAIANDYERHQLVKHFSVEGQVEFKSILYIPKRAPIDLYDAGMKKMDNIKLYVRRVFIMDRIENLLPQYMCFVKGIVDSEDLPLNVSREVLQQNKIIKVMRKHLIKKIIDMLLGLAEDKEAYTSFYENFGKNIKLGIHEDNTNKDKLAKLLRFSTISSKQAISFQEYLDRKPESQKSIYYISGESYESLQNAPFMEKLRSKCNDVFIMTEPMDEYCMNQLKHFNDTPLVCVSKEGLELFDSEEEKTEFKNKVDNLSKLTTSIKEVLGNEVEKVSVSSRLVTTPCVLVTGSYGWTANMERLVKAQALTDHQTQVQSQFMAARKTLEINPDHPIITSLDNIKEDPSKFNNIVQLMFRTSLISSGFTIKDPTNYANNINRLIGLGLDIDIDSWLDSLNQGNTSSTKDSDEKTKTQLTDDVNTSNENTTEVDDSTMEEID